MSRGRLVFVIAALVLLVAFFALFLVYPMGYVLKGSVEVGGEFSLRNYELALRIDRLRADAGAWFEELWDEPLFNSLLLAFATTLATTAISLPLALAMVKRDFRGKGLLTWLILLPMVMPPFVGAIGMKQVFARFGSLNVLWGHLFGEMPNIAWMGDSGFAGVVILQTLHLFPIMYLNVVASLASVDPSCEEAARNLGGGRWNVFRRVTFWLMLPGYFAGATIVFIWSFTDLGTPLILGYRRVLAYQIFTMTRGQSPEPKGFALVVFVLLITAALFVCARLFLTKRLHTQSAKGAVLAKPKRAMPVEGTLILLFGLAVTLFAVVPHVAVVLSSVTEPGGWNGTVLPSEYTLDHYRTIVHHKDALGGLVNSLVYSGLATVGTVLAGVLIAFLLTRERFPGRGLLDTTVMMPLAIPGIVLAFGYITCFIDTPLNPMRNPVPLLVISYIVRRLPYMVRAAVAGFQHVSRSLEEASTNLGARALTTLRRVTLPLVVANLLAGAILTFTFSMFEVAQSLVLAQEPRYFPISRVLYELYGRPGTGAYLAATMGVVGMVVLSAGLLVAARFLGRRMGEIFRA